MKIPSLISFAGFVLIIAATYCPLVHFPLINWDVYDMNKPFGIVILLISVVGIIATVFDLAKVSRLIAWLSFILVILLLAGTIFRVHHEFSFIPIHFIEGYLTKKITYKWGWYPLFAGVLMALAGTFGKKPINRLVKNNS